METPISRQYGLLGVFSLLTRRHLTHGFWLFSTLHGMLAVAFVLVSLSLFQVGAPACLPNPRSLSQRRNVTHDGESYPIGLWVNDWDAAYVTSGVVHILMEDFWELEFTGSTTLVFGVRDPRA